MAVKLLDKIEFNDGKFKFNFLIDNTITVIDGDSSSGKTLFFNKLRLKSKVEDIKHFGFVNTNTDNVSSALKLYKNQVVVIDNADVILSDEDIKYIIHDRKNQYIVFSRFAWKFSVGSEAVCFINEPQKAVFELMYYSRSRMSYR